MAEEVEHADYGAVDARMFPMCYDARPLIRCFEEDDFLSVVR